METPERTSLDEIEQTLVPTEEEVPVTTTDETTETTDETTNETSTEEEATSEGCSEQEGCGYQEEPTPDNTALIP